MHLIGAFKSKIPFGAKDQIQGIMLPAIPAG
jgi:hypothetical protein